MSPDFKENPVNTNPGNPERTPEQIEQKSVSKNLKIFSPTKEDLEQSSIEDLHELWRANHVKLRKGYYELQPPFFGLHGTSQEAYRKIKASGGGHFEMATFYEKEYESEQFFYKLYDAAIYVSTYTNKKLSPGRILVFNLERNGENITFPWENLFSGSSMRTAMTCDSDEEASNFSYLIERENLLWRSDISLRAENFNERFADSIDLNNNVLRKYSSQMQEPWRHIIRRRFLAQEVIERSLKLSSLSQGF